MSAQVDPLPTLADILVQRGLTKTELAVLADISVASAGRILAGKQHPSPETIVRLARALGISADRLRRIVRPGRGPMAGAR